MRDIFTFQISSEEDLRFQLDFVGLALTGRTLKVSVRERPSNALKVDLIAPSNLTLAGAGNLTVFYPRASMTSWAKGIEYEADIIDETAGSATRIMAVRFVYDHPGNLVYGVKGNQASVSWGSNQAVVTAIGGVGPPGPANVIAIGTVDTLETDEPATASLTGSAPTQVLNLGLPKGSTGTAATIAVGTVTTVAPGTPADVTNSGTSGAAVFDFDIPAGAAATIAAGDVTTIAAGQPAAVTNSGTSSAAVFDFDIPAGAAATVAVGTVTESLPGDPPTVTNVGTATAAVFDFTLPRGDQGPPGSVADGDKGDVVVSGGGTVWTVQADAVAIDARMPKTGGVFTGPVFASGTTVNIAGAAGTNRPLRFLSDDLIRWEIGAGGQPETGGNAGSFLYFARMDDAGAYLDQPFFINRATGQATFSARPTFNGATPLDTANFVGALLNCGLAASVGSNALTISLTDAAGSAPSAASPVVIPFRSATAANGNLASRVLTGATTLVISSGSTAGFANATAGRLWIVAFDDGGTVRLGAVNCRSGVNIFSLGQFGIASSTAEGGAGAADSAHVFYTGTAVTSKAYTVLGYLEWAAGLTTAGTWAIVPTRIDTFKPGMKLPGDVVQSRIETNNTYATNGANVIPADNTEPQNSEGDAISTLAVTPSSSANVLDVSTSGQIGSIVANTGVALTICRSDQSNCIASGASYIETAGGYVLASLQQYVVAGTASSVNLTNRYGPFSSGSGRSINGGASVRQFGASQAFVLKVKEIVA